MTAPVQPEHLTLAAAIELALAYNPDLAAATWHAEAGTGRVQQAGLWLNPQTGLTVEDVAGTGDYAGTKQTETTLRLGQTIELGNKRSARVTAARQDRDLSAWDRASLELEVVADTTRSFLAVLGLQDQLALSDEEVSLAEQMVASVRRLVQSGREPEAEATRAEVALAAARIDRTQTRRALEEARQELAASWGAVPSFDRADGTLAPAGPPPSLPDLTSRLEHSPELARWSTELAQRQAQLALAEANAIPDVTVDAGYRRYEETGDSGFVFGASLPLPLFDRNQGAIAAARSELSAAEEEQRAAGVRARTALNRAHAELLTTYDEIEALATGILPAADRAFASIQAGYLEGRYRHLDVLDAQRTLISNRERLVRAKTEYRQALARIDRLTGGPISGGSTATAGGGAR